MYVNLVHNPMILDNIATYDPSSLFDSSSLFSFEEGSADYSELS
jgi:hypothetical protein